MKSSLPTLIKVIKKFAPVITLYFSVLFMVVMTWGFCDSFKPDEKEKFFMFFLITGGILVYDSCLNVARLQEKKKICKGDIVDYFDQRGCAVLSVVVSVSEKEQIATVREITGQQRVIDVPFWEIQEVYRITTQGW